MWKEFKEFEEEICFNTDCKNRASSFKYGDRCCILGCPYRFDGVRIQYDIRTNVTPKGENNS